MLRAKVGRLFLVSLVMTVAGVMFFVGCGGSTSGGKGRDDSGLGEQFVADGGAGATLTFTTVPTSLATGSTTGFGVTLLDPRGTPLPFIRLFCESERGLAILEPSAGGVAFESTNTEGLMSGVLGCSTPGSFIIECRGPDGFGVIARAAITCRGDVPDGFDGFPGAAGGNLGGGFLVEETPDTDDIDGIRVTGITFTDAGGTSTTGPIDNSFIADCDTEEDGAQEEPFTDTTASITIGNGTFERFFLTSITLVVQDGQPGATATESIISEIGSRGSGTFTALLLVASSVPQVYAGGSATAITGTFRVDVTIRGTTESGESVTITDSTTLTIRPVNNCDV